MANKPTNNKSASVLSAIVLVLVVVLFVGFLSIFTNDFTTGIKTFYVKNGSDTIMSDRENYDIIVGKTYKFDIVNNLDTITNGNSGYNVKVVPSGLENAGFDFNVDGAVYGFSYLESLSNGFEIMTYNDYFTFTANKDLTEILQCNFPNKTITGCPTAIDSGIPYFTLSVSSADNSEVINITFNLKSE